MYRQAAFPVSFLVLNIPGHNCHAGASGIPVALLQTVVGGMVVRGRLADDNHKHPGAIRRRMQKVQRAIRAPRQAGPRAGTGSAEIAGLMNMPGWWRSLQDGRRPEKKQARKI